MNRESDLSRRSADIRKFFRTTTSHKAVSQFLRDVELEMAEYQTEINKLKIAIHALKHKQNRLKKTAEMYKPLLAPIYAIPLEILKVIFGFFCEKNVLSRSTSPAAIRLSMVCGRWRDIVYSTPGLWSGITVDFISWTRDFHVLNELTERLMKQSGDSSLRLSLKFSGDDFDEGSEREALRPALQSLIQNCERWESVDLTIVPPHFPSSIFSPINGRLPLLTSLTLDGRGEHATWDRPFDYFEISPALRSLCINPYFFDLEEGTVSLPWEQVTSLHMPVSHNSWAFSILSSCPAVEHLEVDQVDVLDDDDSYSGHITSSKVKTLVITSARGQIDVDGVLQHATLDLRYLPITDEQTISLLRMIPMLTSLCIEELSDEQENYIITRPFLDGLAANASLNSLSSTPLVPRPSNLRVVVHAKDLQADTFLETLSSRWLPDPADESEMGIDCLRVVSIVVILESEGKGGQLDDLSCLRDAGMRLSITYGALSELYPDEDGPGVDEGQGDNGGEGTG
ncbi:hypothetical protein V5O48_011879 [Marasmius crinis-equi]|uniref:F-box domain-containing protein n=1 Tax=Marasmius crinis-equi TaxID=585013 RepID=A0ABR3F4R1_9AGAR